MGDCLFFSCHDNCSFVVFFIVPEKFSPCKSRREFFLLAERVGDIRGYTTVKAIKGFFHVLWNVLFGKQADQRYEYKTAQHGKHAGVQGIFEDKAKESAGQREKFHTNQQLHNFKTGAKDKAVIPGFVFISNNTTPSSSFQRISTRESVLQPKA